MRIAPCTWVKPDMRLAKLAVASVSPTVGRPLQRSRLIAVTKTGRTNVTIGIPEQAIGGYPRIWSVARLSDSASSSGSQRKRADRRRSTCSASPSRAAARSSMPLPSCIAAASRAWCRRRNPDLQRLTKAAPSRGGPGLTVDWHGIPLGDYHFQFDFGDVAVEVCEDAWSPDGPMRRRCYSDRNRRRLDLPHGRRLDPARNAGDAPPTTGACSCERRRRTGRLDLRRRRVHLPERTARVRHRASSAGGPSSISSARGACMEARPGDRTVKRSA